MKVLYCLSHINKSLQWKWFAEEMKNREVEMIFILIDMESGIDLYLKNDLEKLEIKTYRLEQNGKLSYIKNINRVRALIRKYRVDIVHTSLPLGNIIGQAAARLSGIKNRVTTCENVSWAHDFKSKKQEWIDKFTFRSAKRIIATSDIAANYLRKNWDLDQSKLKIIYHGLKSSDYEVSSERAGAVNQQLRINKQKEFIVGVVARFEYWKGHEYIIEAARLLVSQQDIKFYIFGSKGSYYEEAMNKIREYGLQEKVIYGGFTEDTSALYQLFNIHLHVPVNEFVETGGITVLEGMMAERTQLLTGSGYAWQTAKHMINSYVVPFKNAEAIAEGVLWIKNNPEKARSIALQAKKDAFEFSVQKKANQHIELYNELLK